MKKPVLFTAAALCMASVGAFAQSAKFAAVYSPDPFVAGNGYSSEATCTAVLDDQDPTKLIDCVDNPADKMAAVVANIRIPQAKELLVGVSAQVGLFTETTVRGKKGSTSTATAFAEGSVGLEACSDGICYPSVPARIVLSNRKQELEATLAGILESCSFDDPVGDDSPITFDLNDCQVAPEEIRLALETLAAHHYNFLFPNLPQGDYQVKVEFTTAAQANASAVCNNSDPVVQALCIVDAEASATATGKAVVNKTMITMQEVRAVKNSIDTNYILVD